MDNNSKKTYEMLKRLFLNYVRKHKVKLFISIMCMILVAAATALNAWMMQPVLDEIFINKNQNLIILIPLAVILIAIIKVTLLNHFIYQDKSYLGVIFLITLLLFNFFILSSNFSFKGSIFIQKHLS